MGLSGRAKQVIVERMETPSEKPSFRLDLTRVKRVEIKVVTERVKNCKPFTFEQRAKSLVSEVKDYEAS